MAAVRDTEDERGRGLSDVAEHRLIFQSCTFKIFLCRSMKDKAKISLRKYDVGNKFSHLPLSKASVLMPLMVKDGKLYLLFTVRSMKIGSLVTPVVGFIEDTFQARPNPDEVSDVFLVPLEYFIDPLKYMTLPYKRADGVASRLHSFVYDDPERKTSLRIWGLTAHFAVFLALVVFEKKPTFDIQYDLDNLISSSEKNFMEEYMSLYEGKSSKL
ncbi:peroxisomal coenzyme A diphosphatase NUDT7 isoform X6 [Gopherus evgoodei]|uniref:peroxisomal coenzyme A diphosphatase NUDT7 isoform X6 n=1 Tax=Gopherus evgoodei TaxID=1825980 RepID=UPI0011CFEE1E|nr:peroxisomal coenzyme A diphosphatase NUDT7 isoform X6 [Gopherus evgoodei]